MFSELNTPPGCASVNASPERLPDPTHHSRPRRLARSYLVRLSHSQLSSGLCRRTPSPLFHPLYFTRAVPVLARFKFRVPRITDTILPYFRPSMSRGDGEDFLNWEKIARNLPDRCVFYIWRQRSPESSASEGQGNLRHREHGILCKSHVARGSRAVMATNGTDSTCLTRSLSFDKSNKDLANARRRDRVSLRARCRAAASSITVM
jgi:hypothetical protein